MLQRVLHIGVLLSLLLSTVGIPLSRHYCKQELKRTAIYAKAKSCHQSKKPVCPRHPQKGEQLSKKGCCQTDFDFLKLDTDWNFQLASSFERSPEQAIKVLFPTSFISDIRLSIFDLASTFRLYKPPPQLLDRQLAFNIFLC